MKALVKRERNAPCACGSGKKYKKCCGGEKLEGLSAGGVVRGTAPEPERFRPQSDEIAQADLAALSSMMQAGRFLDLERKARELLIHHPNSGVVWKVLGLSLWMQDKDALQALEKATQLLPNDAEAHSNLGNALRRRGRLGDAVASHRRALAVKPDYAEAHNNLGSALRDLGQFDEAAASYRRALAIKSDFAMAHGNLAKTLHDLRQLDEAVSSYRRALALRPDLAEAHYSLGNALADLGRFDDAVASFRQALDLQPDYAEAHANLGVALRQQGRFRAAEASCRRALEINPNLIAAIVFLAQLHADEGQFAEAEDLFKRVLAIQPESPEAWAGIAGLRRMTSNDAGWAVEAQRIAEYPLPPRREASLRYAIGKYFDDVGDFEQAFTNYRRANELTRLRSTSHDRRDLSRAVDLMIQTNDRGWLARTRNGANASSRPVFIVGMPRSGTTLAEQILASHPAVVGAGELSFWNAASAKHASAGRNEEIGGTVIRTLADDYLRQLDGISSDSLRVVDKMPGNFNNLGLIHAALPNAGIIHMQRNPIDTCLSIYFHDFQTAHSYANDLEDLANYYTEYLRIMEHWRLTLPEGAMLEVSYEGLIDDQEAWSRKMLEFLGLPWDPVCLDFHLTKRTITTFSKWQARQKIDRTSVERWRNYQKFVGPLRCLVSSSVALSGSERT